MEIMLKKAFMEIWLLCAHLLENIFDVFKIMAGITPIQHKGGETSILNIFVDNDIVMKGFYSMLIISTVVCAVCIIAAVIKATINQNGERKNLSKITGQGISAIFVSVIMAVIMIIGISGSTFILREVNNSLNGGKDAHISTKIFEMSVENKGEWILENVIDPETGKEIYIIDVEGNRIKGDDGQWLIEQNYVWKSTESGWQKGTTAPLGFDILNESANTIYGNSKKDALGIFETGKNRGAAIIKYDSFNFVVAYLCIIMLLVALCVSTIGLVKRLYDIVFLFITLPLIVATVPLDDGVRFKVWRETVISKVALAFGAVISVNVFLIIVPVILALPLNSLTILFLLIGGGLSISGGQLLFARLFGTSAEEGREIAQSARTIIAGAATARGMARYATNSITRGTAGTYNYLSTAVGSRVVSNTASDAFRLTANTSSAKTENIANALRGNQVSLIERAPNGRFVSITKIEPTTAAPATRSTSNTALRDKLAKATSLKDKKK
jgi:hypothetical protein